LQLAKIKDEKPKNAMHKVPKQAEIPGIFSIGGEKRPKFDQSDMIPAAEIVQTAGPFEQQLERTQPLLVCLAGSA
jgi:hypothetical protein